MIKIEPLSPKRLAHCRSVAAYSYDLAIHWQAEPLQAYLAGIFHDLAREIPPSELLALAKQYGLFYAAAEEKNPLLLHGAVSAVIARENYQIHDEAVLTAMARHTVGAAEMSLLDKIIYVADEIEPLRDFAGVEDLRILAFKDLNRCLLQGIEQSFSYLKKRGLPPHENTLAMRKNLLKEM